MKTLLAAGFLLVAAPLPAQIVIEGLDGLRQGAPIDVQPLEEDPGGYRIERVDPEPPGDAAGFGAEGYVDAPKARLRGLDTLTNTVDDFIIGVGETLRFRRLIVTLKACRYPPDDPLSEAYALLEIRDTREPEPRFSGWMLASSPALSALDHPRYDVWVLACSTD